MLLTLRVAVTLLVVELVVVEHVLGEGLVVRTGDDGGFVVTVDGDVWLASSTPTLFTGGREVRQLNAALCLSQGRTHNTVTAAQDNQPHTASACARIRARTLRAENTRTLARTTTYSAWSGCARCLGGRRVRGCCQRERGAGAGSRAEVRTREGTDVHMSHCDVRNQLMPLCMATLGHT